MPDPDDFDQEDFKGEHALVSRFFKGLLLLLVLAGALLAVGAYFVPFIGLALAATLGPLLLLALVVLLRAIFNRPD